MKARKILILVVFAAVVAAFHFLDLGKYLTLESLKANRLRLEELRAAHAFPNAGASLAAIESVSQVASPRVLGSFALLGLFALLPTILKAVKKRRERGGLPLDTR